MSHEDCKKGHWSIFSLLEDFAASDIGVLEVALFQLVFDFFLSCLGGVLFCFVLFLVILSQTGL